MKLHSARRCEHLPGGAIPTFHVEVDEAVLAKGHRVRRHDRMLPVVLHRVDHDAVDRLVAMGAAIAWEEDFPAELGYRNVVLRDPEGNEFCVGGPPDVSPGS